MKQIIYRTTWKLDERKVIMWTNKLSQMNSKKQKMSTTLTPVPSPTQASDTEPLRSLNEYWETKKHINR